MQKGRRATRNTENEGNSVRERTSFGLARDARRPLEKLEKRRIEDTAPDKGKQAISTNSTAQLHHHSFERWWETEE